jgi:hypothetical protein
MGVSASFLRTVPLLRLLTLSCLFAACVWASAPPLSAHGAPGGWSLAALMPPGSMPVRRGTPFWIELRNDSDAARLVCLQTTVVALRSPDVALAAARPLDGGRCREITDYVVIRPGHALSRVVYVKPRRGPLRGESEPLIELTFVEREVGDQSAIGRRVSVRWAGTIAEARRAGSRLASVSVQSGG